MRGFRFRHPRKATGMSQSLWEKRRDDSIWKLSSRLFSWPDWLPLGLRLRGCRFGQVGRRHVGLWPTKLLMRERRTSGTLGLGTTLFTFVETLVTLRPLRRWFTYHPFANIRESQHWERRGQANSRKSKISWLRRQNPQFRPVQRDATLLHVASVCTPCYMLMGSCCGLKPVKLLTRNSRWSVAQQCWICLAALPTLLGPRTRISHGLRGVYKDLRVVSFPRCTPDPNTVGPRVSGVVAHCWPNNVESCSILVGSGGLHP